MENHHFNRKYMENTSSKGPFSIAHCYVRLPERSIKYQVIQAVTSLSPNVGGQLTFDFGSRFHHPKKKVTSKIARYRLYEKNLGWLFLIGDYTTQLQYNMVIIMNHYKDPY